MIEIHYFASIREALDMESERFELPEGVSTVSGLVDHLVEIHGSKWAEVLRDSSVLVAVNQTMVKFSEQINTGDEVAFFPPVTGG